MRTAIPKDKQIEKIDYIFEIYEWTSPDTTYEILQHKVNEVIEQQNKILDLVQKKE